MFIDGSLTKLFTYPLVASTQLASLLTSHRPAKKTTPAATLQTRELSHQALVKHKVFSWSSLWAKIDGTTVDNFANRGKIWNNNRK